jgi:CYTH domain-containing protein/thymidylate kinase
MRITKIVLTGGPCAGKSSAASWIQNFFTKKGYKVLFVPETASELISGGVAPWTCRSAVDFQTCLMQLQIAKEKAFETAAKTMNAEKILIVCDRGLLDCKAYVSTDEFQSVIGAVGTNEIEARDNYDAVFHLVSTAKGAVDFYNTANNDARTETPEEAANLDDRLIAAWTGHPHFRVIDNSTGFEDKLRRLIAEISSFLGEPKPYETERKFLIEYPDIAWLESCPNCERVEIIQTYLKADSGDEVRIRQRGVDGNYIYSQTTKHKISELKRIEIERRLSQNEYLRLLMDADTNKKQIRKTRYCLTFNNQYFEIDVYPFWEDKAIAEIELNNETTPIAFPEQIKVIKEVTENGNFKNFSLADM